MDDWANANIARKQLSDLNSINIKGDRFSLLFAHILLGRAAEKKVAASLGWISSEEEAYSGSINSWTLARWSDENFTLMINIMKQSIACGT